MQVHVEVRESVVSRVNPSVKLFLHLLCMILLLFAPDPLTTLYLTLIPMLAIVTLAKVPVMKFLLRFSPFLVLFLSTTWLFAAYGKGGTVIWQWGWWHVTREGLTNGLMIGIRMMGYVSYGMLFTFTTDVTKLIFSLMQQCKLPPKFAYALLAGFRFLPMFKEELEQIKVAHRVRGVARVPGVRGKVQAFLRYTVPLLAQAIRKAERVAVALEARGFDGSWNRTFYHEMRLGWADALYLLLLLALQVVVFAVRR